MIYWIQSKFITDTFVDIKISSYVIDHMSLVYSTSYMPHQSMLCLMHQHENQLRKLTVFHKVYIVYKLF